MNRKIKFRIWDKTQKEMNYIDLCDLAEGTDYWFDGETTMWDVIYDATHEQERFIIQQYTGLKDKKGVEIYEGDLLRYSEDTSEISGIDEVFYNEEYGTFEVAINRKRNDTEVLGFYLSRLGIGQNMK